jgi:arylformamidase
MEKIIDLSHVIQEGMPVYPGTDPPRLKQSARVRDDGFNELRIEITTHTGTHIDAPAHLINGGKTLDSFSAGQFTGKACIISCTNLKTVSREIIESSLDGKTLPDFLIFRTGWERYWGEADYFRGFPVPDPEAAEYMSSLPLKGVGVDAPSFDPYGSTDLPNHLLILGKEILLIENLCNLHNLPEYFTFCCLPLRIKDADGSPARAMAFLY